MNTKRTLAAVALTGALVAGTAACSVDDRDRCRTNTTTTMLLFFSTVDRHYHYGSPTGKTVPHYKLPKSARNTPGYKPVPGTLTKPKPPVNKAPKQDTKNPSSGSKPNMNKPAPAPRPAPAPAPRVGGGRR